MVDLLITLFEFLKKTTILSLGQFVTLLSVFFFFGILLYIFARFTRVTFVKSIGVNFDIYITGWLGTPIHELGHALFCIPFLHKINEIKLFSPKSTDGSLGYVNHSYNPHNPWHTIGNFFIGFGPILFGSFIIFLLMRYLVPNHSELFANIKTSPIELSSLSSLKTQFVHLFHNSIIGIQLLFNGSNFKSWQFWIFLYIAMCVASHMELSMPDLKGVQAGLISIFILLFVVNAISIFFNINISAYIIQLSNYTNLAAGIFTWALILSALFFTLSFTLLNIYTLIRFRKMFHPFG